MQKPDHDFFEEWLRRALYTPMKGRRDEVLNVVQALRVFSTQHETFCAECHKDAIFRINDTDAANRWLAEDRQTALLIRSLPVTLDNTSRKPRDLVERWLGAFTIGMTCTRREHEMLVHFYFGARTKTLASKEKVEQVTEFFVTKIGQYPSLVDGAFVRLDSYLGALSESQIHEWKQAYITEAHGFSVAACVHLRRVVEDILYEARNTISNGKYKDKDWPEFDKGRMSDRIKLTAPSLPKFLAENAHIYAVLSKGVHELTEEECAKELPLLHRCMQIVAEQRQAAKLQEKNEADAAKLLSDAASRLK